MAHHIHVACTCEGDYAPHTGTMIYTLLSSNPQHSFSVYVLYQSLPEEDRSKLAHVASTFGAQISFVQVPESMTRPLPKAMFHHSCWLRIFLPELLPELERVLYLDSDLLVRDDLGPLWQMDVSNHLFAAVTNPLYPFLPYDPEQSLHLRNRADYINSGVLLMNSARMRQERLVERVTAYASEHPEHPYPEQDALSALFSGQCLFVDPRWNVQSTLYELGKRDLPFTAQQVNDARRRPAIIHFSGPFKPWVYLCSHPRRRLYFETRARTPWPVEVPAGRTLKTMLLRPLPLVWRNRLVRLKREAEAFLSRQPGGASLMKLGRLFERTCR